MKYSVFLKVEEDGISIVAETEEYDKCYFYLYDVNNEVVEKSGWIDSNNHYFKILESGMYFVKSYVMYREQKFIERTEWFDYIVRTDKRKFNEFCDAKLDYHYLTKMKPKELYMIHQPYANFLVIHGMQNAELLVDNFCEEYGFALIKQEFNTILLCEEKNYNQFESGGLIFSGIGKVRERLLAGNSGLEAEDIDILFDDSVGTFTYYKSNPNGIEVGTDYFGVGKIYYYEEGQQFFSSNNYHMLLLLLKAIGKSLSFNTDILLASLGKMSQPFQQRFSRKCEVEGILILPVDKKVQIDNTPKIVNKVIHDDFKLSQLQEEESYVELLLRGKDEIIDNMRVALESNDYADIQVDLTGGLDSRTVYAALTNFEVEDKNIVINTIEGKANRIDVEIATKVNSIYNYMWDDRPKKIVRNSYKNVQNMVNSHFLLGGYYFPLDNFPASNDIELERVENEEKTLNLVGFYGEICLRPYFTRNALAKVEDILTYDLEKVIPIVINTKDILSVKAYETLCREMREELENLPGNSSIEKYETYYLFYRNSFHCLKVREYEKSGQWGVLQSKNLFRLCRSVYNKKMGIKVQLDVINQLNAMLGCVPYDRQKDNEEKERLLKKLIYTNAYYRDARLNINSGYTEWKIANVKRKKETEYIVRGDLKKITLENEKWKEDWKNRLIEVLHAIMQFNNGELREKLGIDVFVSIFLKDDKTDMYYKTLYNKLLTVFLQGRIIDAEYNKLFE